MKRLAFPLIAGVAAALLTIAPAVYSGSRTLRWKASDELKHAASNLDRLPFRLESWECTKSTPLAESARDILRYESSFSRTYVNRDKSASLSCIMLVGLPGPIVRHPPEFCYEIRDNVTLDQQVVAFEASGVKHAARLTRFKEPGALQREFFVATGWYADGRLGTSDSPRMTYGGEQYIYAIQVVWQVLGDQKDSISEGIGFLQELLPAFEEHCRDVR